MQWEEEMALRLVRLLLAEVCGYGQAHILMSVRHPNIVLFMGMCLQPVCLITEWCSRGSLKKIIRRSQMAQAHNSDGPCHQNLPWAIRLMMAIDIAKVSISNSHNVVISCQ